MPLYEYHCTPCNGVFELIRPVRDASRSQPCPECDEDAKRILSKEWAAFIYRDGMPRRLPDRGKYWHVFEEKDTPMTSAVIEAPEANPRYVNREQPDVPLVANDTFQSEVTAKGTTPQAGGGFFKTRDRRPKPSR